MLLDAPAAPALRMVLPVGVCRTIRELRGLMRTARVRAARETTRACQSQPPLSENARVSRQSARGLHLGSMARVEARCGREGRVVAGERCPRFEARHTLIQS